MAAPRGAYLTHGEWEAQLGNILQTTTSHVAKFAAAPAYGSPRPRQPPQRGHYDFSPQRAEPPARGTQRGLTWQAEEYEESYLPPGRSDAVSAQQRDEQLAAVITAEVELRTKASNDELRRIVSGLEQRFAVVVGVAETQTKEIHMLKAKVTGHELSIDALRAEVDSRRQWFGDAERAKVDREMFERRSEHDVQSLRAQVRHDTDRCNELEITVRHMGEADPRGAQQMQAHSAVAAAIVPLQTHLERELSVVRRHVAALRAGASYANIDEADVDAALHSPQPSELALKGMVAAATFAVEERLEERVFQTLEAKLTVRLDERAERHRRESEEAIFSRVTQAAQQQGARSGLLALLGGNADFSEETADDEAARRLHLDEVVVTSRAHALELRALKAAVTVLNDEAAKRARGERETLQHVETLKVGFEAWQVLFQAQKEESQKKMSQMREIIEASETTRRRRAEADRMEFKSLADKGRADSADEGLVLRRMILKHDADLRGLEERVKEARASAVAAAEDAPLVRRAAAAAPRLDAAEEQLRLLLAKVGPALDVRFSSLQTSTDVLQQQLEALETLTTTQGTSGKLKVDALADGHDRRQRVLDDFGRRLFVAEEQLGPLRHEASKLAPQRVSRLEADAQGASEKAAGFQVVALAKIEALQKAVDGQTLDQPARVTALEHKLLLQFRDKSNEFARTSQRVHALEQDHASLRTLLNESHATVVASTASASQASSALNAKRDAVASSAMALAERAAKQCDALQADVAQHKSLLDETLVRQWTKRDEALPRADAQASAARSPAATAYPPAPPAAPAYAAPVYAAPTYAAASAAPAAYAAASSALDRAAPLAAPTAARDPSPKPVYGAPLSPSPDSDADSFPEAPRLRDRLSKFEDAGKEDFSDDDEVDLSAFRRTLQAQPAELARAEPAPARAEPAPVRAMLSKSSDFDDSDDDESAPARAEPAPARAEPAPARAEPAPVRAEPAPVRAVPKTTPKSDDDDDDDDDDDSVAAPVAAPGASLRDRMQGFNADAASSDDDDDDDDDEPAVAPKVFGGPAQFTARTATAQAPKLQFSGPKTFDSGSEASPAAKGGGAGPAQFTASTAQAPKLSAPKTFDSGSEASPAKGGAQFAGHFSDSEESAPASPLAEASAPRRATARYNAPRTLDSGESPAASPAPTRRTPAQFNAPPTLDSENESPAAPTRRPFNAPRTLDSDESPAASPAPTKRTSAQFNAPQTLDSESDASPAKRSAEAPLFGGDGATFSRRDGANEAPSPAKPAKAAFNPRQSFSDSDASTPAASPAMSASRPNSKAPEKPSPRRNSESESESSPVLTKRTFGKAQPRASETGGRNNLSDDSGSDATPQKSPRGTAARDDDGVSRSPGWRVTALARGGDGEGPPQTVFGKVARGPRRSSPAATFESPAPRSVTQIDSIASYKSSGSEASPRPSEASPRASEARASSPPRRTFVTGASPASPVTRPGPSRSLSSVESFSDASIPHLDAAPAASNAQRASQPPPTPASVSKEEDDDEGSWDNVEASSDEDSPVKRPPVERPAAVQRPVATPRGDDDDSSVDIPMMGSARSSATKSSRKPPQRTSSLPTEDSPLDDIPDLDAESLRDDAASVDDDTDVSEMESRTPRKVTLNFTGRDDDSKPNTPHSPADRIFDVGDRKSIVASPGEDDDYETDYSD